MTARALIISAPRSGAGKTTVALAVIAALRRRGLRVRAAKSGPDYIDTAFLSAASGAPAINLDSWAMPPTLLDTLLAEAMRDVDYLIIEGAMGLFDGVHGPPGRTGAAADIAARFGIPVLLVLDVAGQSQSAAAVLRGFATHDRAVHVAGVVLNNVASERHRALAAEGVGRLRKIPLVGAVLRNSELTLPERHLGLVQADEHADLADRIAQLEDVANRHLDIDRIMSCAGRLDPPLAGNIAALPPPGRRIALARDAAFSFVYTHVLEGWRRAGAEVVPFSPLANEPPPEDCDACWLPGGYPELHAPALAAAWRFHDGLAQFAETRPVHGECGGYMVLGAWLEDADGIRHQMCGLLGHATSFAQRRLHLGYREARLITDSPLGAAGCAVRGHEFHYATLAAPPPMTEAALAELTDGQGRALGPAGSRRGHVSGTFFHAIARAT